MQMRFRVRTRDGRALNPGSLEAFAQLVTDGDVTGYDLVHDALTGEWAPAQLHPVFRIVQSNTVQPGRRQATRSAAEPAMVEPVVASERTTGGQPQATGVVPSGAPPREADGSTGDDLAAELGLSLAPAAPEPSVEEETEKFLAEIAEERESDPERPSAAREIALVEGGSRMVTGVAEARPTPPPEPVQAVRPAAPLRVDPIPQATARPGGRVMWMLAASTVLIATITSPSLFTGRASATDAADRPRALRVPTDNERVAREWAADLMLSDARNVIREAGIEDPPEVWLDGRYFASAVDHPEVRAGWERYLELVWQLRTEEDQMYRRAYLAVLDEEGVSGPIRSIRLASAMPSFEAGRVRRMALLRPVEELAVAAIALHDILVDLDGTIRYEPAQGPILSRDPVLEAAGTTEEAQELLEGALDRVTAALYAGGAGPVERDRVRRWAIQQIEDATGSVN